LILKVGNLDVIAARVFLFFHWDWCSEAIFSSVLMKCNRKMSEEMKVAVYIYFQ